MRDQEFFIPFCAYLTSISLNPKAALEEASVSSAKEVKRARAIAATAGREKATLLAAELANCKVNCS